MKDYAPYTAQENVMTLLSFAKLEQQLPARALRGCTSPSWSPWTRLTTSKKNRIRIAHHLIPSARTYSERSHAAERVAIGGEAKRTA
jgi:hypothetical protein